MQHKLVIINRAVPGSGKTTYSKKIVSHFTNKHIQVAVHSTDDYFLTADGRYNFDVQQLFTYHQQNLNQFKQSILQAIPVIICDNTNLLPWETEPYTAIAREYAYSVLCLNFEPRDIELHVKAQVVTDEKPDAHQVPRAFLEQMIQSFNTYNALLDKETVPNPSFHNNYKWDLAANKKVIDSSKPAKHFDIDWVISIKPNEYRTVLQTIGEISENYLDKT